MSYNIGTEENPIPVFVRYTGGYVELILRADTEEDFWNAAKTVELLSPVTETVTDEETGEKTIVQTGDWVTTKGVDIDVVGPVVITPGTYAEDGTERTAPVIDSRFHVNVRIAPRVLAITDEDGILKWHKWAVAWTRDGTPDTNTNAQEVAYRAMNVALIDPDTIRSPSRVFL